jgi:Family of unknown function (DUF5343)
MTNTETEKKPTVPYVPFKTFLSAIDAIKDNVPANINRSVWPNISGVMISQILGAFRFLGLIHPDGRPTDELHAFAAAKESERKTMMTLWVLDNYKFATAKDLAKMDPSTLNREMRKFNVNGATLTKAITFFLQAARYAELPLSPYLTKKTRGPSQRKKKVQISRPSEGAVFSGMNPPTLGGPTKTIELRNGGTLTLSATTDMFQMTSEDRGFVLKLLDSIEAYEKQQEGPPF